MILEQAELDALADGIAERMANRGAVLPAQDSPWMTTEQAIGYSALPAGTFRKLMASGKLRSHSPTDGGRSRIFHRAELDADLGYAPGPSKVRRLTDAA